MSPMGYSGYLRAIRVYWWMVLLGLVIAIGCGAYITASTQKQYATTVTFFVQTPSDQLSVAAQGDTFGQKRVNSYVQLANTDRLLKPVLADTKLVMSTAELSKEITATGDANTVLMTVRVVDPSAERSEQIARSIAKEFVVSVADLEAVSTGAQSAVRLELVSGPSLNQTPVAPRPVLNLGIAALVGLILGTGVAILRDVLDTSIRSPASLEQASGCAVLGVITYDTTAKDHPLIVDNQARSVRAEAFRQLRTNLEFVDVDNPAKIIVITSSVPNEGKSSTAANLAVIFAEAGKSVLLVEGDLRRPRVADYLGLEGAVGLTNVLAGQVDVSEVLQAWGRSGLTVLPSGTVPPNPSELLGSNSMTELLQAMAKQFDYVLIDSPPLLPVTDAAVLAARADGALLIGRHGRTSRQQVVMAAAALRKVDARLLGCVLNMTPTRRSSTYGYGYSDEYSNDAHVERAPKLSASFSRHTRRAGEPTRLAGTIGDADQEEASRWWLPRA